MMINVLSYVGMSLQSEVCLWTLLGLVRTIFDATLFKVNANLKQVWQMNMPEELSRPVQRALRTMISGIMLVQCFTVYVYLASYIVLLYPVFLEERPTLVLPWLLLAAIRKLLCELTSLALGLGTCVLLGPARPACIKFVVIKVISIMPSFYMWMLLYSYYHVLKLASVFKSFPAVLPPSDHDYGLELAVRRRRTKSLLKEDQLRTVLIANLYNERHSALANEVINRKLDYTSSSRMTHATDTDSVEEEICHLPPLTTNSNRMMTSETGCYEDWFGSEIMVYRDTDRVLEQFGVMMMRIGAYLSKEGADIEPNSQIFNSNNTMDARERVRDTIDSTAMPSDETDTPPLVGNSQGKTASYLRDYPQIFMKKPSDMPLHRLSLASDEMMKQKNQYLNDDDGNATTSLRLNDEDAASNSEFLQQLNSKDTTQKSQTMSREKAVSFKQVKLQLSLQNINSDNNEINEKPVQSNTCINNVRSQDSLQSIIDKLETRGSIKEKSLKKDEINLETQSAFPSRALDKSDVKTETSETTVLSNEVGNNTSNLSISIKLENKNKQNKDNKNETND